MQTEELIQQLKNLPSISPVAVEINRETRKEAMDAKSLGAVIARDPALATKILQIANSAYYGLTREVNTLDRAVTVLGVNTIKSIALALAARAIFTHDTTGLDLHALWHHSLGCGTAAKKMTAISHPHLAEDAFLCGLLHDIGQIAIITNLPEKTASVIALITEAGKTSSEAEKEVLGFCHEEVGALLAESWHFPTHHVMAIRNHHEPDAAAENEKGVVLARIIFIGDQLAKSFGLGKSISPHMAKIPRNIWEPFGIVQEKIPTLEKEIRHEFATLLEMWKVD